MGFGWHIPQLQNTNFQGTIRNFPSSTRAEIAAIATFLTTAPANSTITIRSDSQAAISSINKALNNHPALRTLKNNNLVNTIIHIIKQQKLKIIWEKIKAHNNNPGNDKADQLAKNAIITHSTPEINFKPILSDQTKWIQEFDEQLLNTTITETIKTMIHTKYILNWRMLDRNITTTNNHTKDHIAWEDSINNRHPSKITTGSTDHTDHYTRSFRFKLWNLELPTKDKLHSRSSKIYKDDQCIQCQQTETNTHVMTCDQQKEKISDKLKQIINEEISSRTKKKSATN
jgi:ribonuclease HI